MLFVNFDSNCFGDFESKYHVIANENKGKGISFLMGDVEASKGALQVSISMSVFIFYKGQLHRNVT